MKYLVYLFTLVALPFGIGLARELSLTEALRLARDHSFAVKQAQANADAASSLYSAAQRERFPTLDVQAAASYVDYVPTLDIALPSAPAFSRELGTNENYQTDIRLSAPLYTGGRLTGGIDRAEAIARLNKALAAASIEQVYLQTRVEYFQLHKYDRLQAAAEASLDRATITTNDVQSMYDAGVADSTDLLEARLNLTEAAFARTQAAHARRSAEIRLLTLLGLDYDEPIVLTEIVAEPSSPPASTPLNLAKPELAAAEATIAAGAANVRVQKGGFFPSVVAFGGWSYGKPNLDRFNDTWNDYFTVGARLTWSFNIGNKTARQVRAAEHQLSAARRHYDDVSETLHREVELRRQQLQLAYDTYVTARTRHEIASDNYRLARARHSGGDVASNRLMEIEQMLTAADFSLAAAVAEYHIARSAWLYAIGSDLLKEGN